MRSAVRSRSAPPKLIRCFQIAAIIGDADLETGWQSFETDPAGFFTASGRALDDNNDKVWMFDNEIDWVKRIESVFARVSRREAPGFG